LRILVVDDSRAIRTYIKGVLMEAFDLEVLEASSGFDALRILPRQHIDLIIADINMPDINGLELIKFIRRSERERVLDLGANGFIAKPFTPVTLVNAIKEMLAREPASSSTG